MAETRKQATYYVDYEPRPNMHPGRPWRLMKVHPGDNTHQPIGRYASKGAASGQKTRWEKLESTFNM